MESRSGIPLKIPEEQISKITETLQSVSPDKIPHLLMSLLDLFVQFKMDVAVTGDSGSGKSTLINALLGLDDDDRRAADTGVVETTKKPKMFLYPNNPHLRLWDLPGMGTPTFTAKNYVEKMNFELYDMFIVVVSERFKENNMFLVEEIHKQNKPVYVVRTKVDNDLQSQSKKHKFRPNEALNRMRAECLKYLEDKSQNPQIFLVSGHDTQRYELKKLKDTLERDSPQLREEAFPLFMASLFTSPRKKAAAVKHHAVQSGKIKEKDLNKLQTVCKNFDFVNGTENVKTILETLKLFQLDVAVLGEKGSGTSSLVNALTGQVNRTRDSAQPTTPATSPQYPDTRFWDVSGTELFLDKSLDVMKKILNHFDFYIIIVSDWQRSLHTELARTVRQLRKHYHLVQTKIDVYLQAQGDLYGSEEEVLDGLRVHCAEELQRTHSDQSQLFLINTSDTHAFDFFSLESVLRCDLNTVRNSAFAYYTARVITQTQEHHTCHLL